MLCPIGVGPAHGLCQYMQVIRRIVPHGSQIEAFQYVQHLHNSHATGAGGRHTDYVITPVTAANRLAFFRLVGCKVFLRDQPADVRHKTGKPLCIFSPIKAVCTVIPDQLESMCQIGLHPGLAQAVKRSICFEEFSGRSRVLTQAAGASFKPRLQRIGDRNAVTGEFHSRLHKVRPGHRAQTLMSQIKPCHGARHTDRKRAEMIRVVHHLAIKAQIHALSCSHRRFLSEIKSRRHAVITVIDEKTASADVSS